MYMNYNSLNLHVYDTYTYCTLTYFEMFIVNMIMKISCLISALA